MTTSTVTRIAATPAEAVSRAMALLTESSSVRVAGDGGGYRRHTTPSLLEQLDLIVLGGPGGQRGSTSCGANKIAPMYLTAYDLVDTIKAVSLAGARRLATFPIDPRTSVASCVRQYALLSTSAGDAATREALGYLRSWVSTIRSLIDPPVTREILAPCPECSSRYVLAPNEDGRPCKASAVVLAVREGYQSFISCRACNARWTPEQTEDMARFINPDYTPYEEGQAA